MSTPMECASPTATPPAPRPASSHSDGRSDDSASTHSSAISSDSMRRRIASAMHELQQAQQQLAQSEADTTRNNKHTEGRDGHDTTTAVAVAMQAALSPTMRDTDDPAALLQLPGSSGTSGEPADSDPMASAACSVVPPSHTVAAASLGVDQIEGDSDSEDERVHPHHTQGASADSTTHPATTDATSADCAAILTAPPGGADTQVDSDGLTPLQRHALQQASAKKEKGVSCHQCKTSKDGSVLLFCCNKADKGGKRKRNCRKKYCDACLRRAYNVAIEHFSQEEIDTWQCPACLRKCVCAACARKSDLALQATNKLAAAAVMQTALMHAPFSSMSGLNQLSLLNSMRPGMALSMQMHMAAAAAAIHQAPAAAAPVPAILPAVAVQAVPGAPVASPFQFAQPATTLASSTDAQPQLAQNGSSSGHSSHHSAHAAASVAAQAHGGVTLAAAVVGEHATARPRAFSCPTSPNHAAAQAYAFPPPVPAHAVSAYPIPAISKPGPGLPHPLPAHMLQQRVLPMQPSREARTAQADMTEGTPQRRRRHSLKVTPMGARSNAASRSGSPFKGANQQPITNEQYALQMHAQTQEPQPDFSQTNNFAHTLTQAASDAIPAMDYLEPTHQHHSAPVTPTSQRSRRGSALPYSVGPGMAVRAIDLSVRPPSSGQSSGPNSGQSSPRDSHRQASGNHESGLEMQMMLISPFQQSPQQSPFNLAQHTQHPLHSGTASSHRHGSGLHFLPSPPNQSMLASPMQQPQQQFHVSPHVSPQNQFAPSTLASYLQQIHPQSAHQQAQHPRPHPSELFASPLNASHELDLLSHGASLSLDVINQLQASVQSELATKAHLEQQQQLWQQQQQQQHQRQMQEQHHQQQLEQQHESTQDSQALTGSSTFPDSSLELTAFVDSGSAGLDPPLQLDAFHAGLHPSLLDGSTPPHAQMDSMGAHGPHMFSFAQPQTAAFAHGSDAASAKLAAAHGVSISSMTHGALPFLNTSPNTSPSHQQTAGAPLSSTLAETAPAAAAANGPVPSPPSSLAHNAGSSAFHTGSPTAEFLHMSPAAKTEAV